jgi:hypothetical protein
MVRMRCHCAIGLGLCRCGFFVFRFVHSFRLGFGCASFGWLRLRCCSIAVRWSFIRFPLLLLRLHSNSHVLPMRFGAHIHTTMQILIIAKNSRLIDEPELELKLEPHPRTPNQIPSPPILYYTSISHATRPPLFTPFPLALPFLHLSPQHPHPHQPKMQTQPPKKVIRTHTHANLTSFSILGGYVRV